MEEKLAKYRAKKKATEKSSSPFSNVAEYFKREADSPELKDDGTPDITSIEDPGWLRRVKFTLKTVLWLLILGLFLEYELAGPYLLISIGAAIIYWGTSTGKPRKKNELSAYSVFNPNCVRLEGTFTAEQFENELLRKPLSATK